MGLYFARPFDYLFYAVSVYLGMAGEEDSYGE